MSDYISQPFRNLPFYKRYIKEECMALTTDAESFSSSTSDGGEKKNVKQKKPKSFDLIKIMPRDCDLHNHDMLTKISGLPYYYNSRLYSKHMKNSAENTGRANATSLHPEKNGYVVIAYQNGTFHEGVRISGHSIKSILEQATIRLNLNSAARKLFLQGKEIFEGDDLPSYVSVAVSSGEPYIDLDKLNKNSPKVHWTMSGVKLDKSSRPIIPQASSCRLIQIMENGRGKGGALVTATENFEKFLEDCSKGLSSSNLIKKVYDIEGRPVRDVLKLPKLPEFLQRGYTKILGPVWAASGLSFNPFGVLEYIREKLSTIRQIRLHLRHEVDQLELHQEDTKKSEIAPKYRSLTQKEVEDELSKKREIIHNLDEADSYYRIVEGRMKNMENNKNGAKIDDSNRLVASDIIQISLSIVGEPGNRISMKYDRGKAQILYKNAGKMLEKFLEDLSDINFPGSGGSRKMVRKIFDEKGKEILNVFSLQNGEFLWISHGQNFKENINLILAVKTEKVEFFSHKSALYCSHYLLDEDEMKQVRTGHMWHVRRAGEGRWTPLGEDQFGDMRESQDLVEFRENDLVLENNGRDDLAVSLQLKMTPKDDSRYFDVWRTWVISRDGSIAVKQNQKFVLTAGKEEIFLAAKEGSNESQQWMFSNDGYIFIANNPEKVFTLLKEGDDYEIGLCEKTGGKNQRWAVKQEGPHNLGQMRFCDVPSPEWHKRGLCWPVTRSGEFNEKFEWPMEGMIIPYAPKFSGKGENNQNCAKRLFVVKNGEINTANGLSVTGPDISKMRRPKFGAKNKQTPDEVELNMFLERVTQQLRMTTFSRRLFDEDGREHFTLNNLSRDQIVFASSGEDFISPKKLTNEQKRNIYERKLLHDVNLVENYYKFISILQDSTLLLQGRVGLGSEVEWEGTRNKLVYNESTNFIEVAFSPHIVLGIEKKPSSIESVRVTLMPRDPSNAFQKWKIREDKVLLLYKSQFGLAVLPQDRPILVVQKILAADNGNAFQCWKYADSRFELSASDLNKKITAAHVSNICTYEVTKEVVNQPGFYCEVKKRGSVEIMRMCHSCSRTLRGTSKLYSLGSGASFACEIGTICSSKIDLSLAGIKSTLDFWRDKFKSSRESRKVYADKVRANDEFVKPFLRLNIHRNGDPISEPGIRVCGIDIEEIMELATSRMDLPAAGRKLFSAKGSLVIDEMDISALVDEEDPDSIVDLWLSCGEPFVEPIGLEEQMNVERQKRMKINEARNKVCSQSDEKNGNIEMMKERAGLASRPWKYINIYHKDLGSAKEFYSNSMEKITVLARDHFSMLAGDVKLTNRLRDQVLDLGEVNNHEILHISYNDKKINKNEVDSHIRSTWARANRHNEGTVLDETGLIRRNID